MLDKLLLRMAQYAAGWQGRELGDDIQNHARRALLDGCAARRPGCSRAPSTLLAEALRVDQSMGRAICYMDGMRTLAPLRAN